MSNDLRNLLAKMGTINYKYSLLEDKDRFNIFEILRKKDDEVHLHSRFIAELLNPNGTHGMGCKFLKLFVEMLVSEFDDESKRFNFRNLEKADVTSEKYIGEISPDKSKGGRIDILIDKIGSSPIVIENKIYAEDQPKQLKRYFNYNTKGHIIYLTLYGTEPSGDSLGGLNKENIILLSYKIDINSWLGSCIEKSAKKPELREAIVQYQKLINKLTGNTMSKDKFNEVYDLISHNDNIINARLIAENWNEVKIQTEYEFWNKFIEIIKDNDKYTIWKDAIKESGKKYLLDDLKRSEIDKEKIRQVVEKKQKCYYYYGVVLLLGRFNQGDKLYDIYFKIERGRYNGVCYGVVPEKSDVYNELKAVLDKGNLCEKSSEKWPGLNYLKPEVHFENFSDENTLKMCNKDYRETHIEDYWKEMQEFILKCDKAFNKFLGKNYISAVVR